MDICLATFLGPPQLQVALEIYVQDHQTAMSTRKKFTLGQTLPVSWSLNVISPYIPYLFQNSSKQTPPLVRLNLGASAEIRAKSACSKW